MVTFLIFLTIIAMSLSPAKKNHNKISHFKNLKTIIIDPGHGGVNLGAMSALGIREKVITLSIALKLKKYLDQHTNLNVILTRTADVSLGLGERVDFANKMHGNLFVSIHCNSTNKGIASGVETFFLSEKATDKITQRLCAFENLMPENPDEITSENIGNLPVKKILKDMEFQAYHELSEKLGTFMVNSLSSGAGMINRGVKQAPFGVLKRLQMPGIVLETGFISNPDEAEFIVSDNYIHIFERSFLNALIQMEQNLN